MAVADVNMGCGGWGGRELMRNNEPSTFSCFPSILLSSLLCHWLAIFSLLAKGALSSQPTDLLLVQHYEQGSRALLGKMRMVVEGGQANLPTYDLIQIQSEALVLICSQGYSAYPDRA